ncbi:MAG TPA: Hsp20/alpha crystallin family protein [Steroidobacteraceae bacterium]|jgi:HSP20 family protein|nr:Hsp20/alpha crystallin family protein [Steroidobacteraceae bacterium]
MGAQQHYGSMWLQALELAEEAERLQRRFLRYLGPGAGGIGWEAPVDIHETADGLTLLFALPGVALENIEVQLDADALTVRAVRPLNLGDRNAVIRRLEIPHGRFVRQIPLPGAALQLADSHYANGCLQVRLVWNSDR